MEYLKGINNTKPILRNDLQIEVELQWQINTNQTELVRLRYYAERQADFWEWYESTHSETNNELWDEFEKWEENQNNNINV